MLRVTLQVRKVAEAARKIAAKQLRSGGGVLDTALKSSQGPAGPSHMRLLSSAGEAGAQGLSQVALDRVLVLCMPLLSLLRGDRVSIS